MQSMRGAFENELDVDPHEDRCLLCRSEVVLHVPRPTTFEGVTSDCKPWCRTGATFVCGYCGHVQKRTDQRWRRDVAEIYSEYDPYYLSAGVEQFVFYGSSPTTRSVRICQMLKARVRLPDRGHLLDVGCGNGALLRSFGKLCPEWVLTGADQGERFRKDVEHLPSVAKFYPGLEHVDSVFDLITLLHVLEHIPDALRLLEQLLAKLSPDGFLLVEVPNFLQNPFDLAVVDHCSHFVPQTLIALAGRAGFEPVTVAMDWVPKEISVVLRPAGSSVQSRYSAGQATAVGLFEAARESFAWLVRIVGDAREIASRGKFGIFGTATAGTWLGGVLGPAVSFFVDQDPLRTGKIHLGRPVLHPADVPAGSRIYVALPPSLAHRVRERLEPSFPSLRFFVPPALTDHEEAMDLSDTEKTQLRQGLFTHGGAEDVR